MRNIDLLIAAILLMAATVVQAVEVAGSVGYMSGKLIAQRADGTIKVMGPKSEVLAGDTLVTAKDSYAQVQMSDGARMTLRPHSTLKVEAYRFDRQEPKSDNAIFRLIKGGFRTVTGLIGKRGDPDSYKVRAATATIGIRGTDFSSRLCATPNCQDDPLASARPMVQPPAAPADVAPPGLYVTVHSGQVIMGQADRVLSLGRGETGFASAVALIRLPAPPAFMDADTKQTDAIEAKAKKLEKGKPEESKPDEGKAGEPEKGGAEPDKGPAGESGEKDTIDSGDENADSPDPSINQSGCVVQ